MYAESDILTWRKADRGRIELGQFDRNAFSSCGRMFRNSSCEHKEGVFFFLRLVVIVRKGSRKYEEPHSHCIKFNFIIPL